MDSDSGDDIEPSARRLNQMLRAPVQAPRGAKGSSRPELPAGGLEAELAAEGLLDAPFQTGHLEAALRQQAALAVEKRQHEIEACEQALHDSLSELQRIRLAEEARLAAKVAESTRRFSGKLEELQQQFLEEVKKLKRQTVTEIQKQRTQSEAAIAARVRALQVQLQHERTPGLAPAQATPRTAPRGLGQSAAATPYPSPAPQAAPAEAPWSAARTPQSAVPPQGLHVHEMPRPSPLGLQTRSAAATPASVGQRPGPAGHWRSMPKPSSPPSGSSSDGSW